MNYFSRVLPSHFFLHIINRITMTELSRLRFRPTADLGHFLFTQLPFMLRNVIYNYEQSIGDIDYVKKVEYNVNTKDNGEADKLHVVFFLFKGDGNLPPSFYSLHTPTCQKLTELTFLTTPKTLILTQLIL